MADMFLDMDNVLDEEDIENLFLEGGDEEDDSPDINNDINNPPHGDEGGDDDKGIKTAEDIDIDNLFVDEENPESVGSGDSKSGEDANEDKGISQKLGLYSSIAKALSEDGIFSNLDETFKPEDVKEADDFISLIEKQVEARLDERQKRIEEALNYGAEPNEIKMFEGTLNTLQNITDEDIENEADDGVELRKKIIMQDYLNRGYSKERASREVERSFKFGTDIEDSKESLKDNIEFFKKSYKESIDRHKEEDKARRANEEKEAQDLKNEIFNDPKLFGTTKIDKVHSKKIFDNLTKPVHRAEDGTMLTEIQKYQRENRKEFMVNLGILYTLTNGFKDINGLVKGEVNKRVRRGMNELENTLKGSGRSSVSSLRYVQGSTDSDTEESSMADGWQLDV